MRTCMCPFVTFHVKHFEPHTFVKKDWAHPCTIIINYSYDRPNYCIHDGQNPVYRLKHCIMYMPVCDTMRTYYTRWVGVGVVLSVQS